MFVTIKCLYLKDDIDPKELIKYGFESANNGDSYHAQLGPAVTNGQISFYTNTRRFIYRYPKTSRAKTIIKHMPECLWALVEVRKTVECWVVFGSYHNWSEKKYAKIDKILTEKQKRLDAKYQRRKLKHGNETK